MFIRLQLKRSLVIALVISIFLFNLEGDEAARFDLPAVALNQDGDLGPGRLPFTKLDWTLNQIISTLESGRNISDEELAANAPLHMDGTVGVDVFLLKGAYSLAEELTAGGGNIWVVNDVFLEGFVPIGSLAMLDRRPEVVRVGAAVPATPATISEGAAIHGAVTWNTAGFTGSGIKIGVLDIGFTGYASLMASGEVPSTVVARCYLVDSTVTSNIADCATGVHGSGVSEAIYDIAPDAEFYVTNPSWKADVSSAVDWLIAQGVDVINYSNTVSWIGPGDGTSAHAINRLEMVDRAVAAGITWINAAGNNGHRNWKGSYSDLDGDGYLEFDPATAVIDAGAISGSELNPFELGLGELLSVQIRWDGVWGTATTNGTDRDLNLVIYDPTMTEVASSTFIQDGGFGTVPVEYTFRIAAVAGTHYVAIFASSLPSVPEWIQLASPDSPGPGITNPEGSIRVPAESANPGMMAVGAASHLDTNTIEFFSSQGPTTDGRIKPEIVGVDRGDSVTFGDDGFSGTSQAAPHVTGLVALILERFPGLTPTEVVAYLKGNAEPRGTVPNNTWGYGLAQLAPSPPDAPSGATAVGGELQATVSWTAPVFDGGGTITSYTVTSSPGGIQVTTADGVTLNATVTGLTSGTPYTFIVVAINSSGDSFDSTVSNSVTPTGSNNAAPVTVDDAYYMDEDGSLVVAAGAGVLFNDSDAQSDLMTASESTGVSNGSLTLNSDGSFTYDPAADFNGIDSFTYTADDGTDTSGAATVTITVDAVNDVPSFTTGADQVVTPSAGAQSVVGWATVIGVGATYEVTQSIDFIVSNDNNGLFTVQPAVSSTGTLTYTPDSTASGVAVVSVSIHDDGGISNGGADTSSIDTFTITVRANITGTVTLQGVAISTQTFIDIGPTVILTPTAGGSPLVLASDGTFTLAAVPAGTYTITVSAAGFQSAVRSGMVVGVTDLVMPTIELLSGLVNADGIVDGADLSLVVSNYGMSTLDRMDGAEPVPNLVDLNGDGAVSALDISLVVSNITLTGTQSW